MTAITTIRTTLRDILLPAAMNCSITTFTTGYVDNCTIYHFSGINGNK